MLGAIIGDIVGSRFEFANHKTVDFELFGPDCGYTDDTLCTIATADWLLKRDENTGYTDILRNWCKNFPVTIGGFGEMFKKWLASPLPEPYGSFGNGSAMRVAPVGWAFDSLKETLQIATRTAEITHNHSEGIKGAQAIAAAVFMARQGESKTTIKRYIETAFDYDLSRSCEEIRPVYGFRETCQESVPEAIIAFLDSDDFEQAIRLAVSLGGDSDTLACMAGGIAEAFYGGIPEHIATKAWDYLEPEMQIVIDGFYRKYILSNY